MNFRTARSLGLVAVVAIMSAGAAQAQDTAGARILAAESGRLDAQVAGDAVAVGRAVGDDAVYIHANGAIQSKSQFLADLASGTIRHRDISLEYRTVAVHGETGITHGTIAFTAGVDRRIVASYTGVYQLRNGGWEVVSWQTTPVQPRTAPPAVAGARP